MAWGAQINTGGTKPHPAAAKDAKHPDQGRSDVLRAAAAAREDHRTVKRPNDAGKSRAPQEEETPDADEGRHAYLRRTLIGRTKK